MDRLTLFWILHLALLGLFGLEVAFLVSVGLRARVPGLPAGATRWQKLRTIVGRGLRFAFSGRMGPFLASLLGDGVAHRQVFRVSRFRWAVHTMIFGSFLVLGVFSTVTGLAVEVLPALFPPGHFLNANAVSAALRDLDHPVVALVNETLGLVMLLGVALAAWRRYVRRDEQLRTVASDGVLLALLALVGLSGYPVEAFRLLAEGGAPTAAWGFVGAGLAGFLAPLGWNWAAWHDAAFWFHFALVNLLLFYTPFSRFAHTLASPLVAALNASEEAP